MSHSFFSQPETPPANGSPAAWSLSCPSCGSELQPHGVPAGASISCSHCHTPLTFQEDAVGRLNVVPQPQPTTASLWGTPTSHHRAPEPASSPPVPEMPLGFTPPTSSPAELWPSIPTEADRTPAKPFTAAPEPFTAAPEPFTTAPEPFTATPEPFTAAPEPAPQRRDSPFGESAPLDMSFLQIPSDNPTFPSPTTPDSSTITSTENAEIKTAWGTRVPNQVHASIGSLSTGSADANNALGNTLFRETVERERRAQGLPLQSPVSSAPPLPTPAPPPPSVANPPAYAPPPALDTPSPFQSPEATSYNQIDPFAQSPGNETPAISTPNSEPVAPPVHTPDVPTANGQSPLNISFGTRRRAPIPSIVSHVIQLMVVAALFVSGWIGYQKFVPVETKAEWKAKAMEWLEPGLVIFDFLPFDPRSEEIKEESSLENLERMITIRAAEAAAREAEEKAALRR